MAAVANLILVRHGESQWNRDNRFTGWADVGLTEEGVAQMRDAAAAIRAAGLEFDVAHTSVLRRCIRSQWILLEELDRMWVPQVLDWRLNERHYGSLTGRSKSETVQTFGVAAVQRWRRAYDAEPPPIDAAAAALVPLDRRYAALSASAIPHGESLHQTVARVAAVWHESIAPALQSGQRVLVTGHGNGLRAMIKIIEEVSDDDTVHLEVGNATPVVYQLDAELHALHKCALPILHRRPSEIL